MSSTLWRFSALDTLFFRESRPMEVIGGSELSSQFPPPPSTVAGAIRTAIGEHNQVDWHCYQQDARYAHLRAEMGDATSLGKIQFSGPWLTLQDRDEQWQRLYPVPLNIVKQTETADNNAKLIRLRVGEPMRCDLGSGVRMATTPNAIRGISTLENHWVTTETFNKVLAQQPLNEDELIPAKKLYEEEPRLGIARDNQHRTNRAGLLYQTCHIRPKRDLAIEVEVSGVDQTLQPTTGLIRLGGEGRAASFNAFTAFETEALTVPTESANAHGIILYLLTPARTALNKDGAYSPLPGFIQDKEETVWRGELHGIPLTLHCAITGKALRQGGWDMHNRAPRDVQSLTPAGSLYYCTVDTQEIHNAMQVLHLKQLPAQPHDLALGRGLLAAGLWHKDEITE